MQKRRGEKVEWREVTARLPHTQSCRSRGNDFTPGGDDAGQNQHTLAPSTVENALSSVHPTLTRSEYSNEAK